MTYDNDATPPIPDEIVRQMEFMQTAIRQGEFAVISMRSTEDDDIHYVLAHVRAAKDAGEEEEHYEVYPIGEVYTTDRAVERFQPLPGMEEI